ncbi:MAG TPA: efflux RND transporter periplasmic adaptor subunit [Bacteroidota bacterium]|nr:efflux RND transporter periplasmic adaptor subunit [Bacteroidota bacterium]
MNIPITTLRRLREKKILFPIIGAALFIPLAAVFSPKSTNAATTDARSGEFLVTITVSGEIRAAKSVTLGSPGGWSYGSDMQIIWLIPEGTSVKQGDVVARLDTTNIMKFLNDQQSQLNINLSDLAKLEADHKASTHTMEAEQKNAEFQFELTKLSVERVRFEAEVQRRERELQLKRDSIAVEQAKLKFETQSEINKSEINKVNVQIQKARSDVEKAKHDLRMFTLRAPMPGLAVYEMNWRTGRKVAVSDQIWPGMSVISLPDLSRMQVTGNVNEVDVSKVKKGQKVNIKLDAFPERSFHGVVASVGTIGQQTDRTSSIKTFEVVVDIDETDPVLKPGMTTSLEIIVETVPLAVYVPLESVFSKNGKTVVFRVDHSSPKETEVETGVRNGNFVTILKGLQGGDKVTLRDPTLREEPGATESEAKGTKL